MNVLVACEFSGVVREAFRARGHNAFSCDLLPAEDGSDYHFQLDALVVASQGNWDLMIAHPPCTYLCNSGVRWMQPRDQWEEINVRRYLDCLDAREFFMSLLNAPIPKIAVENPVPHKYADLPKYSQTIQPYMFGDDASKRTCLWLKGLPKLTIPSQSLWHPPRIVVNGSTNTILKRWGNQTDSGQNRLGPSETRASERSRTYAGIANAFAEQWG